MKKILDSNFGVRIALLIAILSKFVLLYNYRVVEGDKAMQAVGAINIMKGKGYTLSFVNAYDFVNIQHTVISEWPPMYAYLLMPVLKITNMDIDTSCYVIDMIAVILFITFFWKLLRQLEFPYLIQSLTLIYLAFFVRYYFTSSNPTDVLALGFLLGALHFYLSFIKERKKTDLLLLAFFMVAVGYTRYMYLPVVFIFPLLLLWSGYKQKSKKYLHAGIIIFLVNIVAITPLLIQNYWVSGSFNNQWEKGLYLKNIIFLAPIFWDMLIDKNFFVYQISTLTNASYADIANMLIVSNYIITIGLIGYFLKRMFTRRGAEITSSPLNNFFIAGGFISIAIILFLMFGSVSSNLNMVKFGLMYYWTYVSESRYFIFIHLYLLINLIYLVFISVNRKSKAGFAIRATVLLLFGIEASHGLWVLVKSSIKSRESFTEITRISSRKNALDSLVNASRQQHFEPVLFFHYSANFIAYASLNQIKFCPYFENFRESNLRVNKPTQVIFFAPNASATSYYRSFLKDHQFKFVEYIDSVSVYSKYLLPDGK